MAIGLLEEFIIRIRDMMEFIRLPILTRDVMRNQGSFYAIMIPGSLK